jgi:hypothetical protein
MSFVAAILQARIQKNPERPATSTQRFLDFPNLEINFDMD